MNTRHNACVVVAILLAVSTAQAATIHVDIANCPGPGDGSVRDPYCSIQTAIDNAVDTDEIIVAPGTYFETIDFLGKAITLQSSAGAAVTTIDAQAAGSVVTCNSGEGLDTVLDGFTITGGNANIGGGMLNRFFSSPTVTDCTFSGNNATNGGGMHNRESSSPTVTNCTFSGNSAGVSGGGMYNAGGSPTVTDCTFSGNTADNTGGGMNNESSSPTVTNCTFIENSAGIGGGIYNFNSSPTVTDCTFSGNSASSGGGMYNSSGSSPTVINCTFDGNTASFVGGGMRNSGSSPTVTNCTFDSNIAQIRGGGMHNLNSNPTITNCTFTGNTAATFGGGGMVNAGNAGSNPTVKDCTFTGNSALFGGAMENLTSSPSIINCQFIDNIATGNDGGGGICSFQDCSPTVTNCTFIGNMAPSGNAGGVGTYFNSFTTITNCTFSDNTVLNIGGGIFTSDVFGGHSETVVFNTIAWGNNPDQIGDEAGATTTVNASDVQGGWGGAGANNINQDPLFVDSVNGDHHLLPGSPCIDAGYNCVFDAEQCGDCLVPHDTFGCSDSICEAIVCDADPFCCVSPWGQNCADLAISLCSPLDLFDITTDLDGNARFLDDPYVTDTGGGLPPIVDMGAYELCVWDCGGDYDGNVGIEDFLGLLAQWDQVGTTCDFGLGAAGVGINEFLDLLANWGPCP